jgi:16S rRNA (adenine1518-N6/adenine1519-N6)-dimethyltransferase
LTLTRTEVRALLDANGVAPSRALGQNFVVDPNTVRAIARRAEVGPGDAVVEIGAGVGSLTLALVETGAEVTAIEIDARLVPILRGVVAGTGVHVVEGDATTLDWSTLLAGHDRWTLVANLPYNVATPLVLDLLADVPTITSMLVMVQLEAGERLAARAGEPAYGIPSVKVAYRAEARMVGRVSPSVFLPRPRVDSALVRIERRPVPAVAADPDELFRLVHAAFGQRRKMVRLSLSALVAPEAYAAAGVRPESRPEELDIEAWGRLADAVTGRHPGAA